MRTASVNFDSLEVMESHAAAAAHSPDASIDASPDASVDASPDALSNANFSAHVFLPGSYYFDMYRAIAPMACVSDCWFAATTSKE